MSTRFLASIAAAILLSGCGSPQVAIQATDKGAVMLTCSVKAGRTIQYVPAEIAAIRVTLKDVERNAVAVQTTFTGAELASRLKTDEETGAFTCTLGDLVFKDKNRTIDYGGTIEAFVGLPVRPEALIGTVDIPNFSVKQNKVTAVLVPVLKLLATLAGGARIALPVIDSVPASSSIQ